MNITDFRKTPVVVGSKILWSAGRRLHICIVNDINHDQYSLQLRCTIQDSNTSIKYRNRTYTHEIFDYKNNVTLTDVSLPNVLVL